MPFFLSLEEYDDDDDDDGDDDDDEAPPGLVVAAGASLDTFWSNLNSKGVISSTHLMNWSFTGTEGPLMSIYVELSVDNCTRSLYPE